MNNRTTPTPAPRELLRDAQRAASRGEGKKALELYEACIREYLLQRMPFKAIAAAKNARTALGATPRVQSLIVRLYSSINLHGDAREILSHTASSLKKSDLSLLRELGQEEFLDLLEIMEVVIVPRGQSIFREYDAGEDLYIVVTGSLAVFREGKRRAVLSDGDIFGELGFFRHECRSATLKALKKSTVLKLPAGPLRGLCRRYPRVQEILEEIYSLRVVTKAREDLGIDDSLISEAADFSQALFCKGQDIPIDPATEITLIKHGIVEINYDERGLPMKRFLKPGSIVHGSSFRLKAHTDAEILQTRACTDDTESGSRDVHQDR
ncbi:MAG: cyclic nucleotide-binding domain-containing protein [Desulfomonilia bacterium]|nr:cyclic nucleotide-binding domain-containing protein [Desulfomonilia bacterium]